MCKNKLGDYIPKNKIVEILCAIILGFTGIFVSCSIAKTQNEIAKITATPYFKILKNEQEQPEYVINNEGGYIQNATVTLKSFIYVDVKNNGSDIFYFPYQVLTQHYNNLKDGNIIVNLSGTHFGIDNWDRESDMGELIEEKFKKANINAIINYLEHIEIEYIGYNRATHKETYAIGYNNNEWFMYQLPPNSIDVIQSKTPEGFLLNTLVFDDADKTMRTIGNTFGNSMRRGSSPDDFFVCKMVDEIQTHIQ